MSNLKNKLLGQFFSELDSESSTIPEHYNFKSLQNNKNVESPFIRNPNDSMPSLANNRRSNSSATSSFIPQHGASYSATSSINVRPSNNSATSSFIPQQGGNYSTTSKFAPQQGGNYSALSSQKPKNDDDVNQLLSMLTSENNSTATEMLENRLRNMLQKGGKNKRVDSDASNTSEPFVASDSSDASESSVASTSFASLTSSSLASSSVSKSHSPSPSKPVSKSASKPVSEHASESASELASELASEASSDFEFQNGGGKGKNIKGGTNESFKAFLDLKKEVAELLGQSNNSKVGKATGDAQKKIKASNPDISLKDLHKEVIEEITKNKAKYLAIATAKK